MLRTLLVFAVSVAALAADDSKLTEARRELLASRYERAVELYTPLTKDDADAPAALLGIAMAQLNLHHTNAAYAAAEEAMRRAPLDANSLTAAGLADYRRGELNKAEGKFRDALKADAKHAIALDGLADIYASVSMYKTARDLRRRAFEAAPDDPNLSSVYVNSLEPDDRIAALEKELALLDPGSGNAKHLRIGIAIATALRGRKLRVLESPYEATTIKLLPVSNGPHSRIYGVAVNVKFNGKQTAKLMLDTGASGISISPKFAEKAGLESLTDLTSEAKGIGDGKANANMHYLASEIRIGTVIYSNHSVSAFRSAQESNYDGLIGADVFRDFLITLDFFRLEMTLTPRAKHPSGDKGPFDRSAQTPAGFYRIFRFGNHLAVPTIVNDGKPELFLIDTGASTNLIDVETARRHTKVRGDYDTTLTGVQGEVKKVFNAKEINLTFAGFKQQNPGLLAINLENMSDGFGSAFGGVLGIPALAALQITIDYREGAVKLELRKDLKGTY